MYQWDNRDYRYYPTHPLNYYNPRRSPYYRPRVYQSQYNPAIYNRGGTTVEVSKFGVGDLVPLIKLGSSLMGIPFGRNQSSGSNSFPFGSMFGQGNQGSGGFPSSFFGFPYGNMFGQGNKGGFPFNYGGLMGFPFSNMFGQNNRGGGSFPFNLGGFMGFPFSGMFGQNNSRGSFPFNFGGFPFF